MRKMPKQKVQLSQATVSTEDIQKICNRNYQNIFPIKNQNQIQNNQIMMQRNQIKEIISQMEIFVQLLIQQILLTSDENIKLKAHDMLMEVKNKGYQKVQSMNLELQESKDQKIQLSQFGVSQLKYFHLAHLEDQVEHISKEAFMQNKSNLQCEAQIQFSIYQSPLLLFTDLVKEIICRNFKEREQIIRILVDQFQPLINPFYLPIYEQKAKILASRGKFTELEDVLLLLGLKKYHLKHQNNSIQPYFDLIQVYYLKDKTRQQIKNRFKNQICARAHDNIIKRWKNTQNLNLLQQERKLLLNGIQWFGTNENAWHLISKYFFMDDRSADFLRLQSYNIQEIENTKKRISKDQVKERSN